MSGSCFAFAFPGPVKQNPVRFVQRLSGCLPTSNLGCCLLLLLTGWRPFKGLRMVPLLKPQGRRLGGGGWGKAAQHFVTGNCKGGSKRRSNKWQKSNLHSTSGWRGLQLAPAECLQALLPPPPPPIPGRATNHQAKKSPASRIPLLCFPLIVFIYTPGY